MKRLVWLRVLLAWAAVTWVTFAFLGLSRTFPAKQQLIPALLMGNLLAVGVILIGTILLGRFYCSVICPLGIFQDGVSFISEKIRRKKNSFRYRKELRVLRYAVLVLFAGGLFSGIGVIPILLDPYGNYGRMVSNLLAPVWRQSVNFTADIVSDSWLIEKYDILPQTEAAMIFASVYLLCILAAAWFGGRIYCNTICPVGTILGTLSRFSLLHPYIREDACVKCGKCEKNCRSSCIDIKTGSIDTSRCVDCMNCIAVCPTGAMTFGRQPKEKVSAEAAETRKTAQPLSRREFLGTGAAAIGAAAAVITAKTRTVESAAAGAKKIVMPPGADTREKLMNLCTACGLCIDRCKGGVLRPANLEYGIGGIFLPKMDFKSGFCDYNCSQCGKVCPTGAITKLPFKKKRATVIGKAVYHHFNCLIMKENIICGNCALHCPTKAVTMTEDFHGKKLPQVNKDLCIGCGSCEYHCPAKPKAIIITGLGEQTKLAAKEKTKK